MMESIVSPRHLSLLLLLLLLQPGWPPTLRSAAGSGAPDCPSGCECKWRDGKETTACAGLGLSDIPDGVAQGTQVLDLADNAGIRSLEGAVFVEKGITNLQKIFLQVPHNIRVCLHYVTKPCDIGHMRV